MRSAPSTRPSSLMSPWRLSGEPWILKLAIWRSIGLGGVARSCERRPTVTVPLSGAGGW